MPHNIEKQRVDNMDAALTAAAKLTFPQLLMFQASMAEHIHLVHQHATLEAERRKAEIEKGTQ